MARTATRRSTRKSGSHPSVSSVSQVVRGNEAKTKRSIGTRAKKEPYPKVKLEQSPDRSTPPLTEVKEEVHLTPSHSIKVDPASVKVEGTSGSPLAQKKKQRHDKSTVSEPFPSYSRPSAEDCHLAHSILSSIHGARVRPVEIIAPLDRAGCGDSPSVIDALIRTILSQNTSDANSSRAMKSMSQAYGGAHRWEKIASDGQEKLEEAIRCGGLSKVKSRVIINILNQVREKYGEYSLDHLHGVSTEEAMSELLAFDGVGPKTASCVLLFCLSRDDFAVDTHVWRITKSLGWVPKNASREQTYHHLNKRIPDEDKYGLHILLVTHGKRCDECKAGGRSSGKCALRKAFRDTAFKGEKGVKGEVKAELKEEVLEGMKTESVKEEKV